MDAIKYEDAALFEHRFWLQILGDHARFIYNALSPQENTKIQTALYFINAFDRLLEISRRSLSPEELADLNVQSREYAQQIRSFKLEIIRLHLVGDIMIELPPTFINHMVNEVEEYLKILCYLLQGLIPPPSHPIHYHLVWLPDAAGHSSAIQGSLDMVEKDLMEESQHYVQQFEQYFIKAYEMAGYMRSGVCQFPALSRFNKQVEEQILMFKEFLGELEDKEIKKKLLGTLFPLFLDHMGREECYYLIHLSRVSEVKDPSCDPTQHRTEG